MYCVSLYVGPLGWCIGRVVAGFEGSLGFGELIFRGIFGMSVGVAVCFNRYGNYFDRGVSAKFRF